MLLQNGRNEYYLLLITGHMVCPETLNKFMRNTSEVGSVCLRHHNKLLFWLFTKLFHPVTFIWNFIYLSSLTFSETQIWSLLSLLCLLWLCLFSSYDLRKKKKPLHSFPHCSSSPDCCIYHPLPSLHIKIKFWCRKIFTIANIFPCGFYLVKMWQFLTLEREKSRLSFCL